VKRFRFRLSRVRDIRKLRERMREAEFGLARVKLMREQQAEAAMMGMVSDQQGALAGKIRQGFTPVEAIARLTYIKRLRDEVKVQRRRVEAAVTEVQGRQKALLLARQERKALDSLYDRRRGEYMRDVLADEQKATDDMPKRERR
jgi:flagellar export protein FliJ